MSGLDTLALDDWAECPLPAAAPPPELVRDFRRRRGMVPGWVGRLAPCAWLIEITRDFPALPVTALPARLWDLAELVVSRDNSCRYCYGMQRAYMRMLGYRDAEIERIERDLHAAGLTPAEVAALEYARKVSQASPRPGPAEREVLAAHGFDRRAIAELTLAAGAAVFTNRLPTILALPTEDVVRTAERPWMRLLQPFLARKYARPRVASVSLPTPNAGPFARVVAALDGSPGAHVIRRAIDAALASGILPRRTKLLMLAVVARALACQYGERETGAALAEEGLEEARLAGVLANLGGPELDAREARLLPFARETVRYHRNVPVQRRLREVTQGMTSAELLEVVGVAAVGNAVCRIAALVDG